MYLIDTVFSVLLIIIIVMMTCCTLFLSNDYLNAILKDDMNANSNMTMSFNRCQEHYYDDDDKMTDNHSNTKLAGQEFTVKEFETKENSLLLYPTYNNQTHSIWVGDTFPGSGRFFEFNLSTKNYTVHNVEDATLITFSVVDKGNPNVIWYIDPTQNRVGRYDILSQVEQSFGNPFGGVISGLTIDGSQNLWMPLMHANKIVKFDTSDNLFEGFDIPSNNSIPSSIIYDEYRDYVWFTESAVGKIGKLDLNTYEIKEYNYSGNSVNSTVPKIINNSISAISEEESGLVEPTVIFLNPFDCKIYVSDHETNSIFSFDPLSEQFKEYPLNNKNGLAFGIAVDRNGYLWVAEHITDILSVIDAKTGENIQVKIPSGSYVQYVISDRDGNIWFAEQGHDGMGTAARIEVN